MATKLSRSKFPGSIRTASPLVLASASPRRSEILRLLGFEFDVVAADIDEESLHDLEPVRLAVTLAEQKAETVSIQRPDACVIAADTVVAIDGISIGKPSDPAEAVSMLQMLSGNTHVVHTGMAVRAGGRVVSGSETSEVTMRQLGITEIESYVKSGAAMDKAGAYGIQDSDLSPVESHSGSYLNIVGLPTALLARLLQEIGEIDSAASSLIAERDSL